MQACRAFLVSVLCVSLVITAGCCCKSICLKRQGFEPAESTLIDGIKYDATSRTLSIAFDSGDIYDYKDVPERVYQALNAAESKGQYFHSEIKGKFKFTER